MKKYIINILTISVMFFFGGCIDAIDFNLNDNDGDIVIEGMVTDSGAPFEIKITKSRPYNNQFNDYVSGADVQILEGKETYIQLLEESPGIYRAANKGQIGQTYQLLVSVEGKQYESSIETLVNNVELKSVSNEIVSKEYLNELNNITTKSGMEIYSTIEFLDPNNTYLRWEYIDKKYYTNNFNTYVFYSGSFNYVKLENSSNYNENVLTDIPILFIEKIKFEANVRHELTLYQYSISKRSFEFWKQVEQQLQNDGSIFDSVSGKIKGNIRNVNDPNDNVIGIFSAASVVISEIEFSL